MLAATENGWPQIPNTEIVRELVPGTRGVRNEIRRGDASTVLVAWSSWFHRNVRSIEPDDGHRNWWGYSNPGTNAVWNSNHYSATAIDLCADELPWKVYRMPQYQVDIVERGLKLFEGNVYWGRNWTTPDEMHFQCGYNTYNNPKFAEFAQRLRDGYLNIYGPPDPLAFPLPPGYYYGPLEGPIESISGEYSSDSQIAKDGLGRWQSALGLPVTKKWNDILTPKAATTLQLERGWKPNPLFGYGGVYEPEWDAVIRNGWRLPEDWDSDKIPVPEKPLTKWGDYSQYQTRYIDDTYPYPVVAFRASIAGTLDTKFLENMRRAKSLVHQGKLKKIIAYHFWVPGHDNWGTFKKALDTSGGVFPELAFMIDVEDGGTKWNIRGDQSDGVNRFIEQGMEYFGNQQAASGYINFVVNASLWTRIPKGLKLIVPSYHDPNKQPYTPGGISYFGHQYTDREDTTPFGSSDMNQSRIPLSMWLQAWGENRDVTEPEVPVAPSDVSVVEQLRAIVRQFQA